MTFSRLTKSDLSHRLDQALSPQQGRLLKSVADLATQLQLPLYIVGGFVRDLLLRRPGLDFDLVVVGDAIGLVRAAAARQGGKVTVHSKFKTAQWFPPLEEGMPGFIDFTTARAEVYKHPAALPTVRPGTLIDDLRRRDFTINTLALRLDGDHYGELSDALGGLEDLQEGILRTLHSKSFQDDPTRLFRMVRYETRYGYRITPETLATVPSGVSQVYRLSAERVRHELDLILEEGNAASILKRLEKLGILGSVHPALEWNQVVQKRFEKGLNAARNLAHPPSRRTLAWTLWLMGVSSSRLVEIEKRLHFDSALRDNLLAASILLEQVDTLAGKKPSQCAAVLDKIPVKAIQAVSLGLPTGPGLQVLENYLEAWRAVKPKTTGHDLKERGLPPGPEYKTLLRKLRAAWLDGEIKTVEQEAALLDKLTKTVD